jgi:signal transduction histidine kinase
VKHAEAKSVLAKLSYRKGKIALSVEDDGKGFEVEKVLAASEADGGFGLRSMRERVTKLDGEFSVESRPGEGTRIRAIIPLL